MISNDNEFNYTSKENNVNINFCSSEAKGCSVKNILSSEQKSIWLSSKNVPQTIILDLTKMRRKPKTIFKYWGIYCWHAYSTNPKTIEILFSINNSEYTSMGAFNISMKPGKQFFTIKKDTSKIKQVNFIKIIIKETYGGNKTYMNQLFFFEDSAEVEGKMEEKEGQSFFNSDNYKEEDDDVSYEPVEPMEKVSKISESKKGYPIKYNKKITAIEDKHNSEEEREENKKMKKIERILKAKDISITKNRKQNDKNSKYSTYQNDYTNENYYEDEENEFTVEEYNTGKRTQNSTMSLTKQQRSTRLVNKTKEHSLNYFSPKFKANEDHNRSNSSIFYTNTYSNLNKRALTPLRPTSNQMVSKTPMIRENKEKSQNDTDYQNLENHLKEMEAHLKSLNVDVAMISSKDLVHSKSFSFTHKDLPLSFHNKIEPNQDINNYIEVQNKENYEYPIQSDSRLDLKNMLQLPTTENRNLSNLNSPNEAKIKQIENKLQNLEEELKEVKDIFNKVSKSIDIISEQTQNEIQPKDDKVNDIINIVLKECTKLINEKFAEYQIQMQMNYNNNNQMQYQSIPNSNYQYDSIGNNVNLSTDSNLNSFENRINKKIGEKLEVLSNSIQNQIFKDFIQPYIQKIENTMKSNLDDIKEKLNALNKSTINLNQSQATSLVDSYRVSRSIQSSQCEIGKSTLRRNEKYDEINKIGEKLYDKLIEKERKLNDLKQEATNILKSKIKSEKNRYSSKKKKEN